jgi:hypothetical protein
MKPLNQKRNKTQAGFEPPIPIFEILRLLSARVFRKLSLSVSLFIVYFSQLSSLFYFKTVRLSLSVLPSKLGLIYFPIITDEYGAFWGVTIEGVVVGGK